MTITPTPARRTTRYTFCLLVLMAATTWTGTSTIDAEQPTSARQLLQEAMHEEEALGNATAAVDLYERVLSAATAAEGGVAATAQLRLGLLYERLGRPTEARRAFGQVVSDYADQPEQVSAAYTRLAVALFALTTSAQPSVTRPAISEEISLVEELSAETPDGHTAIGVLRRPPGQRPFPAIVIINARYSTEARDGVVGTMNQLKVRTLTSLTFTRFLAAGYVTVLAQPPRGDVRAIVDHVKRMSTVDPNSVVVYGAGPGGDLALKMAAEIELAAVATEEPGPWSGYGIMAGANGISERFRLQQQLLEDPRQFFTPEVRRSAQEEFRKISGPIFFAAGGLDQRHQVSVDAYNEFLIPDLKAAGLDVEAIVYPGQPHTFGWYGGLGPTPSEGKEEAARTFFADMHAFFSRHLPTQPEPLDDSLVEHVPVCDALQRRIGRCDHAPVQERVAITVSREILADYVGTYEFSFGQSIDLVLTLEDDQLMAEAQYESKAQLFAMSETEFFAKANSALFEFVRGDDGHVTHVIAHMGSINFPLNMMGTRK